MLLMLFTAIVSLLMPAQLGTLFFNHFGYIHLLSLLTLYAVPAGYLYPINLKIRVSELHRVFNTRRVNAVM
ncbi:hypothetical protein ACROAE_17320 [Shewanella sp. MF05960]|uniref:hypothetical protein n=1 Tax=Shewanella sp. MF05960 TaxID=3434874 RepID=UPI003D79B769